MATITSFGPFEAERSRCSFDTRELSEVIYGGKEKLSAFLKMQEVVSADKVLRFDPSTVQESRRKALLLAAKKLLRYLEEFGWNPETQARGGLFFQQLLPLSMHFIMFMSTLKNLCSDKQISMFLDPALRGEMIGCYAQTELGHGSDIQGLMTTATYDPTKQAFVINTPGTAATKWWAGGLGLYATHAIVFAQLHIGSKKYGVHAFLVPVRDESGRSYPGVQVGDIGPKYGSNSNDDGYVIFSQYEIPRVNMLSKYHKVNRIGEYSRRGNEKISYATMLLVRSLIPKQCLFVLSKGVVIATRYSLVRTQFKNKQDQEIPVLDYQTQQEKILPKIAETYAVLFASRKLIELSQEVLEDARQREKFDRLNESHALCSGVKGVFSIDSLKSLDILRRSAGGHGFSSYSGLPGLQTELAAVTANQGQNTVMILQVARFLLKSLNELRKGNKLAPTVAYLEEVNNSQRYCCTNSTTSELRDPQILRLVFLYHSVERSRRASAKMATGIANGLGTKEVWDQEAGLELVEAGLAHTYYWIFVNFYEHALSITKSQKLRKVLIKLVLLYGVQKITERAASFFECQTLTQEALRSMLALKDQLLCEIRPEALSLVEAFQYDDNTLQSAIGAMDGQAYARLLDWSKNQNPLNKEPQKTEIMSIIKRAKMQMNPISAKL